MQIIQSDYQPQYLTASLISFAQFLSFFRLLIVGLMLMMMIFNLGTFGVYSPILFISLSVVYAIFSITIILMRREEKNSTLEQLANSILDITFLATLTGISGGLQTGIAILTLIIVGLGAGLCSKIGWKLLVLWAIIATAASEYIRIDLFQQINNSAVEDYLPTFFIGISYLISGTVANYLGFRLRDYDKNQEIHQKKMEMQIKINELMMQEMEEGVIIVDSEGSILQSNRHSQIMLLIDFTQQAYHLKKLSERLFNHFLNWRQNGINECEFRLSQNNNIFRARFSNLPNFELFSVIFIEDIEEINRKAQRMKMSALGILTANIAHEIRNPLSAIHQSAELMQPKDNEAIEIDTQNQLLDIILENSNRIDKIIKDVSDLSRRDRVQKEKFSPVEVISKQITSIIDINSNKDNIKYSQDIFILESPNNILIEFDKSHFIQVISNLINNAWHFCKKNIGSIRIFINFYNFSQQLMINIIDDGPGIGDNDKHKIFEPFFTTRSQGTGIGLYVSRELCEANGGSLHVKENAPGAFFSLYAQGLLKN